VEPVHARPDLIKYARCRTPASFTQDTGSPDGGSPMKIGVPRETYAGENKDRKSNEPFTLCYKKKETKL